MSDADRYWMNRALALAKRGVGRTGSNPPVGAVVVRAGRIVGEGWHRGSGTPHAETLALRAAGPAARGATLYVTLEPCCTWGRTPPCTDALRSSGIRRVVVAMRDPNPRHQGRGVRILRCAGIDVDLGIGSDEARSLVAPFAKRITSGLPFVTLKLAATLDGRIADRTGHSRWISGPVSRLYVRRLRQQADALLIGGRTARVDNPRLLARARGPNPWRVILARQPLPSHLRLLNDRWAHRTVIACNHRSVTEYGRLHPGVQTWLLPESGSGLSLRTLMRRLATVGCLHVVCEGGGELAAALLRERLIDRIVWFVAPKLLGGAGCPAIGGIGWPLSHAPCLESLQVTTSGRDLRITAVVHGSQYGAWMRD